MVKRNKKCQRGQQLKNRGSMSEHKVWGHILAEVELVVVLVKRGKSS